MGRYTLYIILSYCNSIGLGRNRTVFKTWIEEYFDSSNNQTIDMLISARDSVETKHYNLLYILMIMMYT